MRPYALQARWVLPITSQPIAGGIVTIADGRIVGVGAKAEAGASVRDLGDVILLPGLVNAHTHLEFSNLTEPLGTANSSLPDWIRLVIANRKQQDAPRNAVEAGLAESVRAGVTTLGEIATSPYALEDEVFQPEVIAFHEMIGFSAARVESVFADLQQRLQAKQSARQLGISPHAPYTVHPELLQRLVRLAQQRNLPLAMHLAESREELQLLQENRGPFRELLEERSMWDESVFAIRLQPLDYLKMLAEAPRALIVHGNYFSHTEIEFVAQQNNLAIVYCPRTHAYFGHEEYPLQQMLERGVSVALGTDSRASNPDLSLLNELRYLARTHDKLSAQQVLKLGTLEGAKALGVAQHVGSLEVGKLANMTAIRCDLSGSDPCEALLHSEQTPERTWIRGREVHSNSS